MSDLSLPMSATGATAGSVRADTASVVVTAAASLLAAAGVIHLVMVPAHMGEWLVEGIGFAVAGWAQIGLALAVATRPSRRWLSASVLVNAALVGLWIASRTSGFPVGPHANHAETVGLVDGATVAMQIVAAILAVGLLTSHGSSRAVGRLQGMATLVPLAIVGLTTAVLVSPSARSHASEAHGTHAASAGHAHADTPADASAGQLAEGSSVAAEAGHVHAGDPAAAGDSAAAGDPAAAGDSAAAGDAGAAGNTAASVGGSHSHGTDQIVAAAPAVSQTGAADPAAGAAASAHSHGDPGAAASAAAIDDKGFSQVMNGMQHHGGDAQPMDPMTTAQLAQQLARTAELVVAYPTVAAAEAAGYRRNGPFAPGLGTHYGKGGETIVGASINDDNVLDPMLIYDGTDADSRLIGFMYIAFGVDGMPEGFAGPNDIWHYHENVCLTTNPDGSIDSPFGADRSNIDKAVCDKVGGYLIDNTGYMLHVWTVPGYENPLGVFHETHPGITCADGTYYTKDPDELGNSLSFCADAP